MAVKASERLAIVDIGSNPFPLAWEAEDGSVASAERFLIDSFSRRCLLVVSERQPKTSALGENGIPPVYVLVVRKISRRLARMSEP